MPTGRRRVAYAPQEQMGIASRCSSRRPYLPQGVSCTSVCKSRGDSGLPLDMPFLLLWSRTNQCLSHQGPARALRCGKIISSFVSLSCGELRSTNESQIVANSLVRLMSRSEAAALLSCLSSSSSGALIARSCRHSLAHLLKYIWLLVSISRTDMIVKIPTQGLDPVIVTAQVPT